MCWEYPSFHQKPSWPWILMDTHGEMLVTFVDAWINMHEISSKFWSRQLTLKSNRQTLNIYEYTMGWQLFIVNFFLNRLLLLFVICWWGMVVLSRWWNIQKVIFIAQVIFFSQTSQFSLLKAASSSCQSTWLEADDPWCLGFGKDEGTPSQQAKPPGL